MGNADSLSYDSLIRLAEAKDTRCVNPLTVLEYLGPFARVATAVAPFVAASALRMMFGKSRTTRLLLSVSTMWFAINVLLAPYAMGVRADISSLRSIFR